MKTVKTLVLSGFGLNCDYETAHVFELVGASAERVHINDLIGTPKNPASHNLLDYHILVFDGGFSWGDDHGAGVLIATRLNRYLSGPLQTFLAGGGLILGICNGFQALVNMGLLPGLSERPMRQVALAHNDCGNFQDRWINTIINPDSPCLFTRGMKSLAMPVRHGEGKLMADDDTLRHIMDKNLAPLYYATSGGARAQGRFPHNPSGSYLDIAGLCSPSGRVFGLMPHPEGYYRQSQHPDYTLKREQAKRKGQPLGFNDPGDGLIIFENAVKAAKEAW